MATITGTSGNDFVHVIGDGLTPPAGFNDIEEATGDSDYYTDVGGGNDRVLLGAGNDIFGFDGGFNALDRLNGGDDYDYLYLYRPATVVFGSATIRNIENIYLDNHASGIHAYTFHDANVAAGAQLTISGTDLEETVAMNIDLRAETDADYIYIYGGAGDDTMRGGAEDDTFYGRDGDDSMTGGAGSDNLNGGPGADTMAGGADGDAYSNPTAEDTIIEAADGGTDYVYAYETYTLPENVENAYLQGYGSFDLTGNGLDNYISGNEGDNRLLGAGGKDYLSGYFGHDSLVGGAGDDSLYGGTGNDTLVGGGGIDSLSGEAGNDTYVNPTGDNFYEALNRGIDTVQSNVTFSLEFYDNIENLTLTSAGASNGKGNGLANVITGGTGNNHLSGLGGADKLFGGAGVDTLVGGDGADTLAGGDGKDLLVGGADNDVLNGGDLADTFRFGVVNTGADTINGYSTALDRFDLAGGTFSNRTEIGGDTVLTHAGGTILITGVTGLNLAQWNARVLPDGGVASARQAAPEVSSAWHADIDLAARLRHEILHFSQGDWVFA